MLIINYLVIAIIVTELMQKLNRVLFNLELLLNLMAL